MSGSIDLEEELFAIFQVEMNKMHFDIDMLRLIDRSEDRGDGWRYVSNAIRPLVMKMSIENIETIIDERGMHVRLTEEGKKLL